MKLPQIFDGCIIWGKKHSPEILMGLGITGMTVATVFTGHATIKAVRMVDQKKVEEDVDKLTPKETVKTVWKCYIPPAIMYVASVGCLIGSGAQTARRTAALATAYTISESALREYKSKVVETIGEKKEREVRESIAKDKLERDPITNHEIIITDTGTVRCYDAYAKRYFTSDINALKKIQNELNDRLFRELYIPLNDFYEAVGLPDTKLGSRLGWRIEQGLLDFDFYAELDEEGKPCLVVDFSIYPEYDYDKIL